MLLAIKERSRFLPASFFAENINLPKISFSVEENGKEAMKDFYKVDYSFVLADSENIDQAFKEFMEVAPKLKKNLLINLTTSHGIGPSNHIYYITGSEKSRPFLKTCPNLFRISFRQKANET